jgi:hypothetical protein
MEGKVALAIPWMWIVLAPSLNKMDFARSRLRWLAGWRIPSARCAGCGWRVLHDARCDPWWSAVSVERVSSAIMVVAAQVFAHANP